MFVTLHEFINYDVHGVNIYVAPQRISMVQKLSQRAVNQHCRTLVRVDGKDIVVTESHDEVAALVNKAARDREFDA